MDREAQLLARYEEIMKRAKRVEAVHEIENLFDTYLQFYNLQHADGMLSCFAL